MSKPGRIRLWELTPFYRWLWRRRRFLKRLESDRNTHHLVRNRERRFVERYVIGLGKFIREKGRVPKTRSELSNIGIAATLEAGYRRNGVAAAKRLVRLPRIQEAISQTFDDANMSLEECADIVASVARDEKNTPSDRLAAVKLRYQVTTGFSPSRGVLDVRQHNTADKFFDEAKMSRTPPPVLVENQDESV